MKILHITAHMGGGAGNAISGMILRNDADQHTLICLQNCEKKQFVDRCRQNFVNVMETPADDLRGTALEEADIVLLHWWHHPDMCRFLADFPDIVCRIVLWAHVSGCTYPRLHAGFAELFDQVYLTTPYSYENPEWTAKEREQITKASAIVYGLGELSDVKEKRDHREMAGQFVIGYMGTLGPAKLNTQFVPLCQEVIQKIPTARFLLVGDTSEAGWLFQEIRRRGLDRYFEFTGYCEDVKIQLARMDVFAYPLNEQHFGTTENAILEAMAFGLPVVLLNQNTEKYIVTHRETGMLVQNKEEYAQALYELYCDTDFRKMLGENAEKSVFKKYHAGKNAAVFQSGLERIKSIKKHPVNFPAFKGKAPYEWFLAGLPKKDQERFLQSLGGSAPMKKAAEAYIRDCPPVLKSNSKGSIFQFAACFPEDKVLQFWKGLIAGERKF